MKRLFLVLWFVFILAQINAQEARTEVITINDNEYNVVIPDTVEELEQAYIRAMTAYLGEMEDYEALDKSFTEYKQSSEETIKVKDALISKQKELLDFKDKQIAELKQGKIFSIFPHVNYGRTIDENSFGLGVGFILFDSFVADISVEFPISFGLGIGWKF